MAEGYYNERGSPESESDFGIDGFDLIGTGDWVLSTEKSSQLNGDNANVEGKSTIGIFIESSDDNSFDVMVDYLNADNTVLGTVDPDIDSDLSSTSPAGGNHHVFVTVAIAKDRIDITATDTSGGAQNNIDGGINIH